MAFFLIDLRGSIITFYLANYALAMTSTAYANILGAAAGANKKLATQCLPIVFLPQLLFAGFFVTPTLIPSWIRWFRYVCPLTYGIRILLVSEFTQCPLDSELDCSNLLQRVEEFPGLIILASNFKENMDECLFTLYETVVSLFILLFMIIIQPNLLILPLSFTILLLLLIWTFY